MPLEAHQNALSVNDYQLFCIFWLYMLYLKHSTLAKLNYFLYKKNINHIENIYLTHNERIAANLKRRGHGMTSAEENL